MPPVQAVSVQDPLVQFKTDPKIPLKGIFSAEKNSAPDASNIRRVQAFPIGEEMKTSLQATESLSSPAPIPHGTGMDQAFAFTVLQTFPVQPDKAMDPETDLSGRGQVRGVPIAESPKQYWRDISDALSNPDTLDINSSAEKIKPDVKGGQTQGFFSESMARVAAFREKVPTEQKNDPDKSHNDKVQSVSFHTGKESGETDGFDTVFAGASKADGDESIKQVPEALSTLEPVPSGIGLARLAKVKAEQTFPVKPGKETAPKTDFADRGQVRAVPIEESSKRYRQNIRDALSNPDTVEFNLQVGKNTTDAEGGQTQGFFSEKHGQCCGFP